MRKPNTNRFIYATLVDHGYDPADPEVRLELGMEHPVDWDAVDAEGAVICGKLDFVLTIDRVKIDGEPVGIRCVYRRVIRDFGPREGAHVYLIGLRPAPDDQGRDPNRIALEAAVNEARTVRRRSWCADIGEIRVNWRREPLNVVAVPNGSFEPEAPDAETPRATADEISRMCDAFDSFCDSLDPAFDPNIPFLDLEPELEIEWGCQATA